MPKKPQDSTQQAARLVRDVTHTGVTRGEDLMGDPETRRMYQEAKRKELERLKQKQKTGA